MKNILTVTLGSAASVIACGLLAVGCGGGSSGSGSSVGNAAIDATLSALTASINLQGSNLDPSITSGVIANPNAAPASATTAGITVNGSGNANSGTAATVTVDGTVTTSANGSGSWDVEIIDDASGETYVLTTIDWNPTSVSYRTSALSYTALAADGTGQAFIIVRISRTGTALTSLTNTDSLGSTLVDFGVITPVQADGLYFGTFTTHDEYLFEYDITNPGGVLTADIVGLTFYGREHVFVRSGGPSTSQIRATFSNFTVGALTFNGNDDVNIPLGLDSNGSGTPAGASDALDLTAALTGGVVGPGYETDISGDVTPIVVDDPASTVVYAGNLAATGADLDDGTVQVDEVAVFDAESVEDPTTGGTLDHAVDGFLNAFINLEEMLYLPAATECDRTFPYFR